MFVIHEDLSIDLTRGDAVTIAIQAMNGDETFLFRAGDEVRLKVTEKKNCSKVVLEKTVSIGEETDTVCIHLTKEDTTIGEVISKPVDYWYEVELNPNTIPQTMIGYDENGAKIMRLYPEGGKRE